MLLLRPIDEFIYHVDGGVRYLDTRVCGLKATIRKTNSKSAVAPYRSMNRVSVKSKWLPIPGIVCRECIFHVCKRCIIINITFAVRRVPNGMRQTSMLRLTLWRRRRGLGNAKLTLPPLHIPLHRLPRSQIRLQVRGYGFLMATRRSL